jgi:hypothetical protein
MGKDVKVWLPERVKLTGPPPKVYFSVREREQE